MINPIRRPKILLLNPPGKRLYLRDYYCSKISQADYINHPIDLLFLSGRLARIGDVRLVDAVVDRLSPEVCLERVAQIRPDIIVGLIASVSYAEDIAFYSRLRQRVECFVALSGDILVERRVERLRELAFADAFVHDFASDDLPRLLEGANLESLANLTVRIGGVARATPIRRESGRLDSFPVPLHELFAGKKYRYPFVRSRRFATVLTEFGCPYPCNFCIMSTLGWRVRPVGNVLEELDAVFRLGVRELFVLDQTFGLNRARAVELLESMCQRAYGFGWVCFSRPDVVEDDLLEKMRRAGCHTVILGVESGSEEILEAAQKGYRTSQIKRGFELCHKHGLRTVGTIVVGLPEETWESFDTTLEFLGELSPGYVSINVAVPRMGTPLRQRAVRLGLIDEGVETMDQSGQRIAMPTLTLSRSQVATLKRKAARQLYFNLQGLRSMGSRLALNGNAAEVWAHIRQGAALFRNHWLRRNV